jgi:transposase InsO family protein
MTEEDKKQVAAFRFGVICDLVNAVQLAPGEQERLIRDKCARKWQIPFSQKSRIGRSTVLRWVRLYRQSNGRLESLYPKDRSDRGMSRGMDDDTCLSLVALRKQMPKAPVRRLIHEMEQRRLVCAGQLKPSTVYRFLHRQELMTPATACQDHRKFEAELPNDLWQSDVMHGPKVEAAGKKKKAYLIAIIDDHSRLITHGQFYLSERLACYLDVLKQALLRRGLPRKLYVDNGSAFRSKHLQYVTASLGIALIHARPYKPQGKGKIERFFRTVRGDFLFGFKGQTLNDLNEAFDLWLNDIYHQRIHSATGQSPFKRFTSNIECLRAAPADLIDHFRQTARRRVAKDRTITLNGRLYEAPVALIGRQVELLYHPEAADKVEICYRTKSYGMATQVDVHVNCRVSRDKNSNTSIEQDKPSTYHGGCLFKGGSHENQ